jgi:hypothetical protein
MERERETSVRNDRSLHDWKEDYTRQSQPPARGAPLDKQRLVV